MQRFNYYYYKVKESAKGKCLRNMYNRGMERGKYYNSFLDMQPTVWLASDPNVFIMAAVVVTNTVMRAIKYAALIACTAHMV